jgi:hypothetical protein
MPKISPCAQLLYFFFFWGRNLNSWNQDIGGWCDALPVAIAEQRQAVCITADEETQYRRLRTKGYPVELL